MMWRGPCAWAGFGETRYCAACHSFVVSKTTVAHYSSQHERNACLIVCRENSELVLVRALLRIDAAAHPFAALGLSVAACQACCWGLSRSSF